MKQTPLVEEDREKGGGDFMRRLPLVVALVLVLVSGVSVYAVPYPYGSILFETKGDLRAIAQRGI